MKIAQDHIGLLHELATLPLHPESVPINMLVQIEGTPLAEVEKLDVIPWIRTHCSCTLLSLPNSYIRLLQGVNRYLIQIRRWHYGRCELVILR